MSGSTACPYEILGVSELAKDDEIKDKFEACKQAYELLIDGEKRRAYDRQKFNEEKTVLQLKIEQLEKELQKKSKNGDEELEKLRKELGQEGGAGHFWEDDRGISHVGVRNEMEENELKNRDENSTKILHGPGPARPLPKKRAAARSGPARPKVT